MRFLSRCMVPVVLLLSSCREPRSDARNGPTYAAGIPDSLYSRINGIYNGHFKQGLMTLVINYISDTNVSGYDIHRGLRRNVNGMVHQNGDGLAFILSEPGNNPLDGTYYISMDAGNRSITGKWVPQDSSKAQGGPLDLKPWYKDPDGDYIEGPWYGDRGTLLFNDNGTCHLSDAGISIWGNYEQKKDTFYIEWEPNNYLPTRKIKLVRSSRIEGPGHEDDPKDALRGNGMEFELSQAG